jgi:hypothetical protein
MKPLDENILEAHSISKLITNRNDNPDKPEVQELFEFPELAIFD